MCDVRLTCVLLICSDVLTALSKRGIKGWGFRLLSCVWTPGTPGPFTAIYGNHLDIFGILYLLFVKINMMGFCGCYFSSQFICYCGFSPIKLNDHHNFLVLRCSSVFLLSYDFLDIRKIFNLYWRKIYFNSIVSLLRYVCTLCIYLNEQLITFYHSLSTV